MAAALGLGLPLGEGDGLRIRESGTEADAGPHRIAPGKSPVEDLHVDVHLPEVRLQVALLVAQQADIAHEAPAVGVLEEGYAEVDRRDARLLVRAERAAPELHDREQIAGRDRKSVV